MTAKSSLYGLPRPRTSKPTDITPSTNSAFTTTLSSLLATTTKPSTSSTGRPRPSKTKPDIFTIHNKGSKKRALADLSDDSGLARPQTHSHSSEAVDAATLHRSKRKMEEKARLYASMKRGDYVPPSNGGTNKEENALVDFDRKWAEREDQDDGKYSTQSDDDDDEVSEAEGGETVEYEDEFGRLRHGTRAVAARQLRRRNAQAYAEEELSRMKARPDRPDTLIVGDTIQTAAFNPDAPLAAQMEHLASKRDRSVTPPEETHYDASKEVRSKGVGFYQFSQDGEERRERRKKELEERKRVVKARKEERLAERFLEGLDGP